MASNKKQGFQHGIKEEKVFSMASNKKKVFVISGIWGRQKTLTDIKIITKWHQAKESILAFVCNNNRQTFFTKPRAKNVFEQLPGSIGITDIHASED